MRREIYLTDKEILQAIGDYVFKHKLLNKSFKLTFDHNTFKPFFGKTIVKLNGARLRED